MWSASVASRARASRRQLARVGIEEIRVRGLIGAADAAADLVELREAEHVGALDDQRVRLRDVDARLDDRRRDEHVGVAAQERVHLVLELLLRHLAVRDEHARRRHELLHLPRRLLDRLDAVVQIERLTVALQLALERHLDQLLVVLAHRRADRAAALGRRLDDRDVAHAGERHVQRARDRRRAQRQHVDLEAERLQELLLLDAEALLLVEDDEAELLRDHVAAQHAVRADEHVDLALGEVGEHLLHLASARRKRETISTRTGKSRKRSRNVFQCCSARIVVGASISTCLLLIGDRERGADRDLGLAEADVAADEPVHRPRRLEVLLHRLDRVLLIRRLAIRERRLELLQPLVVQVVRDALRASGADA